MLITDYRTSQRNDLADVGSSQYFTDAQLDDFHARALKAYARLRPQLKRFTLQVVAGEDAIALPADWIGPDRKSFETALNIEGAYTPANQGYNVIYRRSQESDAPSGGFESDFGTRPYPYFGTPQQPISYTFLNGNSPQLVILPAPTLSASYPIFYEAGYALPTAETPGDLADIEADSILAFACHLACDATLGDPAQAQTYKVGDRTVDRKAWVAAVTAKSLRKREDFDRATRERPYGSMG